VTRPQPTQQRSRQRVEAILEAARQLLRDGGVEVCTISAIAAAANTSPASLYRYFADSSAVLHALAEHSLDETHERLKTALATVTSRAEFASVLAAAIDEYIKSFRRDRALRELWFGTLSDPALVALNLADSRRNGDLIAATFAPFVNIPLSVLKTRGFLLSHIAGSAVGLMLDVSRSEQQRLRIELHRVALAILNDPAEEHRLEGRSGRSLDTAAVALSYE
jgi:AcrR family transcriptional regulator